MPPAGDGGSGGGSAGGSGGGGTIGGGGGSTTGGGGGTTGGGGGTTGGGGGTTGGGGGTTGGGGGTTGGGGGTTGGGGGTTGGGGGTTGGGGGAIDAGVDGGIDAGPGRACTTGPQCLSNLCVADAGDCFNCQMDSECGFGRLCGTGVCEPACTTSLSCAAGRECCGGRCVDLQRDPAHCGTCPVTCTADEFCGRGQCRPTRFDQLCQLPTATVMLDGVVTDGDAGQAIAAELVASCTPAVTMHFTGQDDGGVLRNTDGAPIALGELLVMGGGSFRQGAINWLESTNTIEVKDSSNTTDYIYSLKDGGVASTVPLAMLGNSHDRVVIQLVRAPSGSVVLNAAGYFAPGTAAAARWFVDVISPMRATLTTRWYIVEWTDSDGTPGPTTGDTFTIIASGS